MNPLQQSLLEEIAACIGIKAHEVDPTANLVDLGLESLDLLEVLIRFEERHGLRVSIEDVFAHPTVESLAAAVGESSTNDE